jgi:hypothetical protein
MAQNTHLQSSLPPQDGESLVEDEMDELELEDEDEPLESNEDVQAEIQARRQGWRPLEEYRGAPGEWVDAKTFLQRGRDFLPFVRAELQREKTRNANLETEVREMRTKLDENTQVLNEVREMARTAGERAYQQALGQLKQQRREAAATGDMARYDELDEQVVTAEETRGAREPAKPPEQSPKPQPKVEVAPEVMAFMDENPWMTNSMLYNAMQAEHLLLLNEAPGLPLAENLERAKEAVMAKYPRQFGRDEPTPAPAPVARPPRRTVQRPTAPNAQPRGRTIDSIEDPVERDHARRSFERYKRQMPGYTEREFMTIYADPHADVLELGRQQRAAQRKANNGQS